MKVRLLFVCAALLTGSATPSYGQQTDGVELFRSWVADDVPDYARSIDQTTMLRMGLASVGLAALSPIDDDISRHLTSFHESSDAGRRVFGLANRVGGVGGLGASVGLGVISLVVGEGKFQTAALTSVEGILLAGVVTGGLKIAVGRARPDEHGGQYAFRPFSGNDAFPSGHTTLAFAFLTPWAITYDTPLSYSLLVIAGGTGIARIARGKHWPTDVVAGGLIGFFTSRWLTRRHVQGSPRGGEISVPLFRITLPVI